MASFLAPLLQTKKRAPLGEPPLELLPGLPVQRLHVLLADDHSLGWIFFQSHATSQPRASQDEFERAGLAPVQRAERLHERPELFVGGNALQLLIHPHLVCVEVDLCAEVCADFEGLRYSMRCSGLCKLRCERKKERK